MKTRQIVALVLAIGLAGSLSLTRPTPAAASDGYTETGATTYVLDPATGRLSVTVKINFKNLTPPSSEPYTCWRNLWTGWYWTQVPDTCYRTTKYYYYRTRVYVEEGATSVKAMSGGSRLRLSYAKPKNGFRVATIEFPNLYYGQTRAITLTYVVPGGAPRSASPLRLTKAYIHFCTIAAGDDSATVTVKVPSTYSVTTSGDDMGSTLRDGILTFTSGRIDVPYTFYSCIDGSDPTGFLEETLSGPSGLVIKLRSWPEDAVWEQAVKSDLAKGLPSLEALIGQRMPIKGALTVEEAVTGSEYAGFFDRQTNTVTVDEDYTQTGLVDHELAHGWFNRTQFSATWMAEGAAEWASQTTATGGTPCTKPMGLAAMSVDLSTWPRLTPRSTDEERAALDLEYRTACWVYTAAAEAAGPDGTRAALGALLANRDPYAADPAATLGTTGVTWQGWLDAWDELGLRAAGAPGSGSASGSASASASLLSDMLLAYGVAADRAALDARASARAAYHALAASVGDWSLPAAVRAPMTAWKFADAQTAITAASRAWDVTGQTDAVLGGVDARHGPAARAWSAASTVAELEAATTLAQQQLDAATAVAAAQTLAATPLGTVQQVGLLGSALPLLDSAVAAVRDGDTAKASAGAASLVAAVGGLEAAGQQRLIVGGAVVGALLLAVLAMALVARSRRARRRAAAAASAASSSSSSSSGTPGPDEP